MQRSRTCHSFTPTPIEPTVPTAKIVQHAVRSVHRLAIPRGVVGPVRHQADVVDQHHVDPAHPEPLEARRQGVPRGGRRVVEHGHEGRRVDVGVTGRRLGGARHEAPADLGREDERVARLAAKSRADALLAEPVTVERRGVEIAHARGPGRAHRVHGLRLGDRAEEVPEGRPAGPETGHPHPRAPEHPGLAGIDRCRLMRPELRERPNRRAKTGYRDASAWPLLPAGGVTGPWPRLVPRAWRSAREHRPGRRPVWRPSAITGSPLTRTHGMPRG